MKTIVIQFRSTLLFLTVLYSLLPFSTIAQPALQESNRVKEFGKSLKKYEKRDNKAVNKNKVNDDIIRVETNLVVNDILVVNQKGEPILGLNKDDFIISENGESQEIGLFSFGGNTKIPRSIVLIIDYSTSLLPYVKNSAEAAKLLIDKLDTNDRMAIVTDDVELLVDFTNDKMLLRDTLDNLTLKCLSGNKVGKSMPFSALLSVLNELFNGEEIRPIIIFQSDGDEFSLLKPIQYFSDEAKKDFIKECKRDKWFCERDFSFDDVTEKIERSNATIYSVIPGIRFVGFSDEEKLQRGAISTANRLRAVAIRPEEKLVEKYSKKYAATEAKEKTVWQTSMTETANLSGGYASYLENPKMVKRSIPIFLTLSRIAM